MKVLKVIVAATMLFAAQKASAIGDVSVFGGYTTVNMTAVNALITGIDTLLIAGGGTATSTTLGGGLYAGVDAGFNVMPFLKVGPRIEYLSAGQAKLTATSPFFSGSYTIDASMMMYEAGVSGSWDLPVSGLVVGGGVWLGYGMASVTNGNNPTGGTASTDAYSGSGFVSEVQGQIAYKFIPTISVGLDLGYRIASISQVTANADNTNNGVKAGDVYSDPTLPIKAAVPFDYSGVNVGARVSFGF